MMGELIQTLHPIPGKMNRRISSAKYEVVRNAIIASLTKKELTHTELIDTFFHPLKDFPENISWYGMTVRLDLEARGVIRRTKSRPQKYQIA